jgi:hypothetical protein
VAIPEGALDHALHDEEPDGGVHAQAGPARTRDSVPEVEGDPLSLTERNKQRLLERWGQPITEPVDEPVLSPGDDGFGWRDVLHGVTVHIHLVRDPLPSMRAVLADYRVGLEDAQQQSATAAGAYRVFGRTGHAFGLPLRFLANCCDRPGRFAGLLFIAFLLAVSLWWAGLL